MQFLRVLLALYFAHIRMKVHQEQCHIAPVIDFLLVAAMGADVKTAFTTSVRINFQHCCS
jgi:hypothetical protein